MPPSPSCRHVCKGGVDWLGGGPCGLNESSYDFPAKRQENPLQSMPSEHGQSVYICLEHALFWYDAFGYMKVDSVLTLRLTDPTFAEKLRVAEQNWRAKRTGAEPNHRLPGRCDVGRSEVTRHVFSERFTIANEDDYHSVMDKKVLKGDVKLLATMMAPTREDPSKLELVYKLQYDPSSPLRSYEKQVAFVERLDRSTMKADDACYGEQATDTHAFGRADRDTQLQTQDADPAICSPSLGDHQEKLNGKRARPASKKPTEELPQKTLRTSDSPASKSVLEEDSGCAAEAEDAHVPDFFAPPLTSSSSCSTISTPNKRISSKRHPAAPPGKIVSTAPALLQRSVSESSFDNLDALTVKPFARDGSAFRPA